MCVPDRTDCGLSTRPSRLSIVPQVSDRALKRRCKGALSFAAPHSPDACTLQADLPRMLQTSIALSDGTNVAGSQRQRWLPSASATVRSGPASRAFHVGGLACMADALRRCPPDSKISDVVVQLKWEPDSLPKVSAASSSPGEWSGDLLVFGIFADAFEKKGTQHASLPL